MAVVTIDEIDQALYDKLGGTVTGNRHTAAGLTVNGANPAIFIGEWAPSYDPSARSRDFPAISMHLINVSEDGERLDGRYDVTISEDNVSTPPTRTVSEAPQPYIFSYRLTLWARAPRSDKEMLSKILAIFLIQDTLTIDSTRDLYMLRGSAPARLNENFKDQITYRTIFELTIFAEIQPSAVRTYKKITEGHAKFFIGVDSPESDRNMVITDEGVTINFT